MKKILALGLLALGLVIRIFLSQDAEPVTAKAVSSQDIIKVAGDGVPCPDTRT